MARHILKCEKCNIYTMSETCKCGGKAIPIKPAKFSPKDSYGEYRRQVKKVEWKEKGLL